MAVACCRVGSVAVRAPDLLKEVTIIFISEVKSLIRVRLFVTPWTVAYQAPPPMGFSRQEYWSGLPFPSPEDLPDPGIKPRLLCLLHWQMDCLSTESPGKPMDKMWSDLN